MSGCGITGAPFCCCASRRLRNSSERPLGVMEAWRTLLGADSGRNARAWGRRSRGPRGRRKRGIDWRVAMAVGGDARCLGSPQSDEMKIFRCPEKARAGAYNYLGIVPSSLSHLSLPQQAAYTNLAHIHTRFKCGFQDRSRHINHVRSVSEEMTTNRRIVLTPMYSRSRCLLSNLPRSDRKLTGMTVSLQTRIHSNGSRPLTP